MKIGDTVTWTSQSIGIWVEKSGTIIADIRAGENARKYVPQTAKKSHIKFDDVSTNDRMLVAVPAGKNLQLTHYYCPRKSTLVSANSRL